MKSPLKSWVRALEMTAPIAREPRRTLPIVIDELAERFNDGPALVSPEATLNYGQLAAYCARYARWAVAEGLRPGDTVGLMMGNCAHYMATWLGLTRAGISVALLNTQLRGAVLAHCIRIVAPKLMIVGSQYCDTVPDARTLLDPGMPWWAHGAGAHELPRVDLAVEQVPSSALTDTEIARPSIDDRALFIYTSGTTGLPKAANVSHFRVMQWSHWFAGMMATGPTDRMYDCLPLYHSVGGVVATGATLVGGGTVILRERFSARDFWRDVVEERCTLFQYIGELCRYLVATPANAHEALHSLRLCCGNGLRGEVWEEFQRRFRIPQILEYYASTEGNFSLYNCEGKAGAIGRIPPFLKHRMPVEIVRFDQETETPTRDAAGHCARCDVNETGEAIGALPSGDDTQLARFEGYADATATSKKILHNVFVAGDAWYRTGDLMRRDEQGFFYFVDRVGDTFRWKGENVSAAEVSGIVAACPGVSDAAVYGVQVPGTEGRAGMAAIVTRPGFDLKLFRDHLSLRLPDYARPVFVRIVPAMQLTGTFKLSKQSLMTDGFDPARASAVYIEDRAREAYVELDGAIYAQLQAGALKL
ncbi:MAG TPA: long-chain-acyl-CoA synthetase [Steroidobacteraceae bacterium]|nr:long-chain-acyl-CoA synthetase [Steroidobacteraceae bacterium]